MTEATELGCKEKAKVTITSGEAPCVGQTIFEDDFSSRNDVDESKWTVEKYIPEQINGNVSISRKSL